MGPRPATNLTAAFNSCDPARPLEAGDARWVDLAPGRGDEGSALAQCRKRILRSAYPLVQLLAGHRGSGKSTELRRLQRQLESDGYFVAYFEADADLDIEDTEPPDLLLAYIRNLEAALREAGHQLGVVALQRGDFAGAQEWYRRSLAISEELGNRTGTATTKSRIGALLTEQGDAESAVPLNLESLAIRLEIGSPDVRIDLYWLRRQREMLGPTRFEEIVLLHTEERSAHDVLQRLDAD